MFLSIRSYCSSVGGGSIGRGEREFEEIPEAQVLCYMFSFSLLFYSLFFFFKFYFLFVQNLFSYPARNLCAAALSHSIHTIGFIPLFVHRDKHRSRPLAVAATGTYLRCWVISYSVCGPGQVYIMAADTKKHRCLWSPPSPPPPPPLSTQHRCFLSMHVFSRLCVYVFVCIFDGGGGGRRSYYCAFRKGRQIRSFEHARYTYIVHKRRSQS